MEQSLQTIFTFEEAKKAFDRYYIKNKNIIYFLFLFIKYEN